jgi:hypothetical protein
MIRLRDLLHETNYDRIDKLPPGKLFDDAKNIKDIFKMSHHTWSEVIEAFEKNQETVQPVNINISDIRITQPNIRINKVKQIIANINTMTPINAVQFTDGEIAIYDGHHRLVANWALDNQTIGVNLVKLNQPKYDASGIDTPGEPTM